MPDQLLDAALLPDGTLQLEWLPAAEKINKHSELLQQGIYANFTANSRDWFFLLGFCNKKIHLAPALSYWRRFSGLFVRRLSLTPDIEQHREGLRIALDDDDLDQLLEAVPPMSGGEYLQEEVLHSLWAMLHEVFADKISAYAGSVAEFVREFSPDTHLACRIYFHLVENRN